MAKLNLQDMSSLFSVGEASLPRLSGEGFLSHSVTSFSILSFDKGRNEDIIIHSPLNKGEREGVG